MQKKKKGKKEKLCFYSAVIYCVCRSTIPPWQCVAVAVWSLKEVMLKLISFSWTLKTIRSGLFFVCLFFSYQFFKFRYNSKVFFKIFV